MRPDKQIETFNYKNELGFRCKAKIINDGQIIYEGYVYYKMSCFNPVRSIAENFEIKITWKDFSEFVSSSILRHSKHDKN